MSGGNLVSDLMKEINSSDLYNEPKYNPEIEQQPKQQQETKKNINPNDFIPPPNEDDKEENTEGLDNQEEDYSSDEEDDNQYDQDVDEILKYANQEYTSFVMELIKNGIIIFIGYIIFSHPISNFYITSFISKMPGIGAFASNNNYMLLITACLFLVYYFIVSFVF